MGSDQRPDHRGFTVLNATKNDPFFSSTIPTVESNIQWVQATATRRFVPTQHHLEYQIH